jgi:GNAT superfamily N-acetyltransferase
MTILQDPPLLLPAWSATLTTLGGLHLKIRPVSPEDETAVRAFFAELSPDDLHFRFLSPIMKPADNVFELLLGVDHVRTEDFLVFVDEDGRDRMIASAMLSCDPATKRAEVAIAVHPAYRNKGVGWSLLDFIARDAEQRGMEILQSIECPDNRGALDVEKDLGFEISFYPDDPHLDLVTKRLGGK